MIGCEYASIFGGLGAKVELINPNQSLLTFLDTEISDALAYHLRNVGVRSRHLEETEKIEYHDDHLVTFLCSGKRLMDIVLWANGRTGNTQGMGLEKIGLKRNGRGQLSVNASIRRKLKTFMQLVMLSAGRHWPVRPMIREEQPVTPLSRLTNAIPWKRSRPVSTPFPRSVRLGKQRPS